MKRILSVLLAAGLWSAAAQAQTFFINGAVVTPERVIPNGWVAVQDGKIVSITAEKPDAPGVHTLVTKDIVFPGFIDLHNHQIYGVFPRWKAPKVYANRYEWRGSPAYNDTIQNPEGRLVLTHFCDMNAYVDLKALAGGTTSMLGLYEPADVPEVPACVAGLVRNLDWASGLHGDAVGQEPVNNILGVRPFDQKLSQGTLDLIKAGKLNVVAVHLAEGRRDDAETKSEFAKLEELKLLNANTVVIHGVALTAQDFAKLRQAGGSFVWSPRSNFELYGQTADVPAAVKSGVMMALAPDWSPTGSTNMLAEIVYAKQVIDRDFPGLISARQLFEMATANPARMAKIADKVGSLAPGLYADLFLLRGDAANPYEALTKASPQDVTLTLVNGAPVYGSPAYLAALGVKAPEKVTLCGAERAVDPKAFPEGGVAGVTQRLKDVLAGEKLTLAGLAECG